MRAAKHSGRRVAGVPAGPRAVLSGSHRRILAICDELEEFADALPNRLDAARCGRLAGNLVSLLAECHQTEERCFQSIRKTRMPHLSVSIARLRSEHRRDEYFAEDIAAALGGVRDTEPMGNPEAFGFILRSFFETQRRHVAFEEEHIIPALASD